MKIIQFSYPDNPKEIRVGLVKNDQVIDLNKADPSLGKSLIEILKIGHFEKLKRLDSSNFPSMPLGSVRIEAPITGMDKVIGVGMNYRDHCEEIKAAIPEVPLLFSKFSSTVVGQSDAVQLRTNVTQSVDYEVELAVVIGKTATNIRSTDAYGYVFGYTVAQDICCRDWMNKNGGQFLLGKSMDTFTPLGPWIVTTDEIKDPHTLDIECAVNGVLKQKSNTKQQIKRIPEVIERLTSVMTLYPGDVILTGTPGGVGFTRTPPEYLKPGDVIVSRIQGIGELTTYVVKM